MISNKKWQPFFIINFLFLFCQGNTPLLLAYMNGQGALCRVLVRAGACLAAENKEGISIFNYQVCTLVLRGDYKLLLGVEPIKNDVG